VHQVLDHVLPADVENKCDARLKRNDVREVLFWSNTEVRTGPFAVVFQRGERVLKQAFIRYEVVGKKVPTVFGKIGDQFPEFLVAEPNWRLLSRPADAEKKKEGQKAGAEDAMSFVHYRA